MDKETMKVILKGEIKMYICTEYKIETLIGRFNERIYTYQNKEEAITNSMNYIICRYEDNMEWIYYYRGKRINIKIVEKI